METRKAYERRLAEGYFEAYCKGRGVDIGSGPDPLVVPEKVKCSIKHWDKEDGDATYMRSAPDASFDFVYSSHCLEHLSFAHIALRNWWRILKPGGYLLISIPHRDLYEKREMLPSNWNSDHKMFWLLDRNEPPCTFGFLPLIRQELPDAQIIKARVVDAGSTPTPADVHSTGEYAIEAVLFKPLAT